MLIRRVIQCTQSGTSAGQRVRLLTLVKGLESKTGSFSQVPVHDADFPVSQRIHYLTVEIICTF